MNYLMRKMNWNYEEALIWVRERRGKVRPRTVFVEQLKKSMEKYQKVEDIE
jgi:hypothetical protein